MRIQSYIWLFPFLLFIVGYYLAYRIVAYEICEVPSVIGKSTYEAIKILSDVRLQTRIVAEREDNTLAEGTVISQKPAPQQKIKPQQAVFLIVSKKPAVTRMPHFIDLLEEEAQKLAHKKEISIKKIYIPHMAVAGKCLAQIPEPESVVPATGCAVYISAGTAPVCIMPDCRGLPVVQVVEFFKDHGLTAQIFHEQPPVEHQCIDCPIIDQRPFPGTCINIQKPVTIQLQCS